MQSKLFQPEFGYAKLAGHAEIFEHIVQPHGLWFDPAAMRDLIARESAKLGGEVPVISSEILSGNLFQAGLGSDVYAERLAQIAPQARILISVRNQMRILPAVYMQYIVRGGTMPYDLFFEGAKTVGYHGFAPEHFQYDRLVAKYQTLFGAENVHVLTQESLKADMEGTAQALADFAGNTGYGGLTPAARAVYAPSYPEYAAPVLRRINHIQESPLNPTPVIALGTTPGVIYRAAGFVSRHAPMASVFGARKPVSDYVKRRFAGVYSDSNARLSDICANAIDLSGYP